MSGLFVSCPPKLETLLLRELEALGCQGTEAGYSGVHVPDASFDTIYRINYGSRLASRVLLKLKSWRCWDAKALYRGVQQLDWGPYFKGTETLALDVTGTHPRLRNRHYAAQVCKDAICDQLKAATGRRPSVERRAPDVQLHLFLTEREVTLSFDTSGAGLHERGYRRASVEAPLRENLAAALLIHAGYTGAEPLCDPLCGGGTILAEAMMIATRTPAGYFRKAWGFQKLPGHEESRWRSVRREMESGMRRAPAPIWGIDCSAASIQAAKENLEVLPGCKLICADFRDVDSVQPQMVVTNPPHNKRLDVDERLYRDLGSFLKRRCRGVAAVLMGELDLKKSIGLSPRRERVIYNGGIKSSLCIYRIFLSVIDK